MLCEDCGQNEATVRISVIVNGENKQRRLCAECMEKIKSSFSQGDIQSFLSAILSSISTPNSENVEISETSPKCSRCGLTLADFKQTGKLGCAQCYSDFREQLKPMLLRIHGRSQHAGRIPLFSAKAQEMHKVMEDLRRRMDQAVSEENFEEAALLRDQLKQLAMASEGNT